VVPTGRGDSRPVPTETASLAEGRSRDRKGRDVPSRSRRPSRGVPSRRDRGRGPNRDRLAAPPSLDRDRGHAPIRRPDRLAGRREPALPDVVPNRRGDSLAVRLRRRRGLQVAQDVLVDPMGSDGANASSNG